MGNPSSAGRSRDRPRRICFGLMMQLPCRRLRKNPEHPRRSAPPN